VYPHRALAFLKLHLEYFKGFSYDLGELLKDAVNVIFSKQDQARVLNLEHFEETDLFETIPHPPVKKDSM
jgi:hypothetical protein